MPTNDFIPFGISVGANVLSQSSYVGLSARSNGFISGIAESAHLNKVWRQGSIGASVMGEFVSRMTALDALDDGQFDPLFNNYIAAYRSQKPNWVTFTGTANARITAFDPVPVNLAALIGVPFRGVITSPNTGPSTLNPNSLGNVPILRPNGQQLQGGEMIGICEFVYDGINVQLVAGGAIDQAVNWITPPPGFFFAHATPIVQKTPLVLGVWTKITSPNEDYDYNGWFNPSTSRFQPTKPGFYFIVGSAVFGSGVTLPTAGLRAFLNGNPTFGTSVGDVPGTQYSTQGNGTIATVAGITRLNGTTDFAEMYGFMDENDSSGVATADKLRWGGWFIGGI